MMEGSVNDVRPQQRITNTAFTQPLADETGGGKGPEPTRYGDWEKMAVALIFDEYNRISRWQQVITDPFHHICKSINCL
jgi:hypothetical protein